jgi:hypothetical protein
MHQSEGVYTRYAVASSRKNQYKVDDEPDTSSAQQHSTVPFT